MTTNFKAKPLICRKLILVSFLSFSGCFCLAKKSSQQQFFRVKPHDVEVGQGGSVIISCEVGNRRGRVQWTKDGLTLGKSYCKCQNSSQPHFVLSLSLTTQSVNFSVHLFCRSCTVKESLDRVAYRSNISSILAKSIH